MLVVAGKNQSKYIKKKKSFIEIKYTYYVSDPLKMYNSMVFSIEYATTLTILEHFHHLR